MMKRYGQFRLPAELIDDRPDVVADAFWHLRLVPFRAEFNFADRHVHYMAICEEFDEADVVCSPPPYEIKIVEKDGKFDGVTVERLTP